jgi:hypothetical protein
MKKILLAAMLLSAGKSFAQQDSTAKIAAPNPLTFSGYVEAYYSYDLNKPVDNNKPGFIYSHNRHNEFNINLAFVRATYNGENVRGTVALGVGTYMNANYAAEPGTLKNIYEANAGVKLSKKKNLWLDAGIFASHIGVESAVSKDCWNVTRSIVAENSPYFETGAKLTYTSDNSKWIFSALALNGWQRITRVTGNSLMSFGTQVQYIPSKNLLFNYSTFIGTDRPDSARKMRYYNNLYSSITVGRFGILPSVDIGMEQKDKGSDAMNIWLAPVLGLRYTVNDKWKIAARGEYYADPHGVIISTASPNGFKTASYTFNVDYAPAPFALIRMEVRTFKSKNAIFIKENNSRDNDNFLTASIAISF